MSSSEKRRIEVMQNLSMEIMRVHSVVARALHESAEDPRSVSKGQALHDAAQRLGRTVADFLLVMTSMDE